MDVECIWSKEVRQLRAKRRTTRLGPARPGNTVEYQAFVGDRVWGVT